MLGMCKNPKNQDLFQSGSLTAFLLNMHLARIEEGIKTREIMPLSGFEPESQAPQARIISTKLQGLLPFGTVQI
jgi:hypothetical protein